MSSTPLLPLGPIGLGCVTFGREIDQTASFALMDHALARGIRHFDTAAAYAAGTSERIVGDWLASRAPASNQILVATKILPPYDPALVAETVDRGLSSLGGRVALLYLHKWEESILEPAFLEKLGELVRTGRVEALGLSNVSREQLNRAVALQARLGVPRFRAIQNNQNLAVRDVDDVFRADCVRQGVNIVTYSPLGAGFLTGKHRDGVPKGSRFDLIPGHQRIYFQDLAYKRLARLESIAARTGHSQTRLALAWALHQPEATVLIGGRSPAHIDQAFDAWALDDPALFAELGSD